MTTTEHYEDLQAECDALRRPDSHRRRGRGGMTIQAPPVQVTRASSGIDAAVALVSRPDGNLEDALMLLRRVATADLDAISTVDPAARLQGLCAFVASRLREQFSDAIRTAPPAALKELVDFAVAPCRGPRCMENVLPWDEFGPEWCSAQCRTEDLRQRGE